MTKINTKEQYDWAVARVEELLPLVDDNTPTTDPKSIELFLLSNLVADYEDVHYPIKKPSLIDVIKLRMYEMNLTQNTLAAMLGTSQSKIGDILSGKKDPTLKQARLMAINLNISPGIILGI